MNKYIALFFILASPVLAEDSKDTPFPFTWPESYMYTYRETGTSEIHTAPFYNMASRSGENWRNESFKGDEVKDITIFRLNEAKKITVSPDGKVTTETLPKDYPKGNDVFPVKGTWQDLGLDTIRGRPAHKYYIESVSRKRKPTIWLSADNKVPLRMEEDAQHIYGKPGKIVVEFFNYYAGPLDPALFEASEKSK